MLAIRIYEEQDERTIGRDIQPLCGRSYSDTDLHTFVTACTSGSWLENAASDVAPKQGFDPWIVGNVAPGPKMPAAESQYGAEGREWANVLLRDSFRTWGPQDGILNHQVNIWCRLNLMSKSAIKAKLFAWNSHEQFFFNLETPRAICKSIVFNGY